MALLRTAVVVGPTPFGKYENCDARRLGKKEERFESAVNGPVNMCTAAQTGSLYKCYPLLCLAPQPRPSFGDRVFALAHRLNMLPTNEDVVVRFPVEIE